MSKYEIPELPLKFDLENKAILKQASLAHRQLAELKGVAHTIPNENILISTLTLQEAKDSSEVESIVTTQDDLYRYTKIDHTIEALGISRPTASRYLEIIVKLGLLDRVKVKKTNYYINRKLTDLLINHAELEDK